VTSAKGFTHQSVYNGTGSVPYYSFNGIQYGRLIERFAAPAPICRKSFLKTCQDPNPSISRLGASTKPRRGYPKCPQAIPDWVNFKKGTPFEKELMSIPDDEVEDCLFLDVIVPRQVWDQTHDHSVESFAPVFVWIHGGGFTSGSRDFHDDPSILLAKCLEIEKEGVILVSINYRLGLFGFLASEGRSADSNVGLLDQRMALGWIEKYISKFGGDPFHITVVGEGTGAGSILHHLTAPNISRKFFPKLHEMSHWYQKLPFHNWQRNFPFQSAILHSPMIQPILPVQLRVIVDQILVLVGRLVSQPLTRISELCDLPYEALYAVNRAMVRESPYGTFTFGPSADYAKGHRSYVPDTPLRRVKAGEMASSVNVFVGSRRNEGR
ncbi:Carboxylesterase patB, partial [Erysiphe neolycopersici]